VEAKEKIARRAALELHDGEFVNLGFGMPTAVPNYLPDGVEVILQTENGALGFGATPYVGEADPDNGNAAGQPITLVKGSAIFDICESFAIIRGGHVNTAILGALEVDQHGNIANWAINAAGGNLSPGMGGAMDLVGGAKRIICTLQHNDKKGSSKILQDCKLAVTGRGVVNLIISDKAVFEVQNGGLVLIEKDPELSVEDIKACTDAEFTVSGDLKDYRMSGINA
jgi:3-oxoacid CoA-transferase B subunit